MADDMLCMHCLEEGRWEDEDCCPKCREKGHVSPWRVSQCPGCNAEFHEKMGELRGRLGIPVDYDSRSEIARLKAKVARLEQQIANQQKAIEHLSSLAIHQIRF